MDIPSTEATHVPADAARWPQRPPAVPANAEYLPQWQLWGAGQRVDGAMHGDWRLWQEGGAFLEESSYHLGEPHGVKRRFYADGSMASEGHWEHGAISLAVFLRPPPGEATVDMDFTHLAAAIHRVTLWSEHGLTYRQEFHDADGQQLGLGGEPLPPRPAGLDEAAFFQPDDGCWVRGTWRPDGTNVGPRWYFAADGEAGFAPGELIRLEYYRDGTCEAVLDWRRGNGWGDPILAAGRAGDDRMVEKLLAEGISAGTPEATALAAAYHGLATLARRLREHTDGGAAKPRPAEPDRREPVPPDALWVAGLGRHGAWVLGSVDTDGTAVGQWDIWHHQRSLDHEKLERTEFHSGRIARRRVYKAWRMRRVDNAEHHDGFPLDTDETLDADGTVVLLRRYERGVLEQQREHLADGTVARSEHHSDASVKRRRVTRDDTLVIEEWFAEDGARLAEVRPVAEPHVTSKGKRVMVELWRGFDHDGNAIAEGKVRAGGAAGGDGPIGRWRLLGAGGAEWASVRFKPLRPRRRPDLGQLAVVMHTWHTAPAPAQLAGVADISWSKLSTFFGSAEQFPFYLKGLAVPDELAVETAIAQMWDPMLHQGTIDDVTGPAVRFMVALLPAMGSDAVRGQVMQLLAAVATREGDLGAAFNLKDRYRRSTAEEFGRGGEVEPAYFEVYQSISEATALWTELSRSTDDIVRNAALVLLACADGAPAAQALRERAVADPEPTLRADAILGLTLHGASDETAEFLRQVLAGDRALTRCAAALTWIRLRLPEPGPAVEVLVDTLATGELDGFGRLYLGSGNVSADVVTTLALLPTEHASAYVAKLCAALADMDALNAASVANALLDVVFPTRAYRDGDALTGDQRAAILAIADSKPCWVFNVNLFEVLDRNGLPRDPDELRALAER